MSSNSKSWHSRLSPEPVAIPNIRILSRESSNGSCWLELSCSSERGDEVSYRDSRDGNGTGALCRANGSVLRLRFPLRSAAFGCVCTAHNPISSQNATYDTDQCGSLHGESQNPGIMECWNSGIREFLNPRILELQNPGIPESWDFIISEPQNP
uniref:Uncharacterized protein n=1 Tax=Junco hyemalis TaxID=40217 RepID=A0A8C5IFY7_JUNHY